MNDWLVRLAFLAFAVVFLLMGVLALVLPDGAYARLLQWWSGISANSELSIASRDRGWIDSPRRLAGLVIALMGAGFLTGALKSILKPTPISAPAQTPVEGPSAERLWYGYVLGVVIFLFGLYSLLQPERILNWSVSRLPFTTKPSDGTLRVWILGVRVMGALMMYASLSLFTR